MSSPILTLSSVQKKYGSNVVIDDLDLEIHAGRLYTLLGRNGTGKSTLMRLLMRHEPYDKGQGVAFGLDMASDSPLFNQNIGFVSENIQYQIGSLTVHALLDFHRRIRPGWDDAYVKEALQVLQLPNNLYGSLSRGQKMQVAFLAASAFWPKLLLLDEITSVLDALARDFFLKRLSQYVARGGTAIVATNIISEVQQITDQVILLQDKKVRFNSSLKDLTARFVVLRKTKDEQHSIFSDPDCIELAIEEDGTLDFLLPKEKAAVLPAQLISSRRPSVSDIFLFMSKARD